MIVLQDVDVIVKCAQCGFFPELPELLGCEDVDIKILPSARFIIEKKIRPQKEVLDSALSFCRDHDPVPELKDTDLFDQIREQRIDQGEALLFALAIEQSASIFTGDKRAIQALFDKRKVKTIGKVVSKLKHRLICFEEILLRFYEKNGFDDLRRCCVKSNDKMLMQCFSKGIDTDEENALYGIRSNFRHLAKNSGEMLIQRKIPNEEDS